MPDNAPIPTLACASADLASMDYLDAYCHDTALMHNTLIRAFNGIIARVLKIQPCEIPAFSVYVAAFCETLRRHCEGESSIIFPRFRSHGALDSTDNLAVVQRLKRVEEWVRDATEAPEKSDPAELKAAMEILAPVFASNMHDQVKWLSPTTLREFVSGPELRALVNDDIMWIGQNSHIEYLLPFLFLHHDRTTNACWPGLPEQAKSALPELVGMHPDSWVYAPFDLAGNPRSA
ncbi:hypothetical protein FS749_003850 [Ceratobasidium sp. UAMH 11750]|nr:hypothetical protein FS749_003850 [Ceratobasidium sp. UAMH 11750]